MIEEIHESILVKARKLLILSQEGVGGERANALRAFNQHLKRHGLTIDDIDDTVRTAQEMECVSRYDEKPTRNIEMAKLAIITLRYVAGDPDRDFHIMKGEKFFPVRGLKPDRSCRIYLVRAEVTRLEWRDWRDCFEHYAPDFLELQEKLNRQRLAAHRAAKAAFSGFVNKHQIFPPTKESSEEGGKADPARLAAVLTAMRASGGSAWKNTLKIGND